jgi:hypothetical protein
MPRSIKWFFIRCRAALKVQSMSGVDVSGHLITQSDRNELVSIPYGKTMIASWRILLLACFDCLHTDLHPSHLPTQISKTTLSMGWEWV